MATYNFDDPFVLEDSDQEDVIDSEEEGFEGLEDAIGRKLQYQNKKKKTTPQSDSEDEFEKEMMAELDSHMASKYSIGQTDEEKKKKEEEIENAALFYDPQMDDDDQMWVDEQRKSYHKSGKDSCTTSSKPSNASKTDAVLNCPACMCTVCLDCQRHELYKTQYRAMFTLNTLVNYGETLQFKKKEPSNLKNKRKRKHNTNPPISQPNDYNNMVAVDPEIQDGDKTGHDFYHPVTCSNCNTRIAVYDSDEIYHFYNVISSYS